MELHWQYIFRVNIGIIHKLEPHRNYIGNTYLELTSQRVLFVITSFAKNPKKILSAIFLIPI